MITLGLSDSYNDRTPSQNVAEGSAMISRMVRETAAWCSLDLSEKAQGRSLPLSPTAILSIPDWSSSSEIKHWLKAKSDSYEEAVSHINEVRSRGLLDAGVALPDEAFIRTQGKLLLYEVHESVNCGASQISSQGFFDGEDSPPWDTWFHYANGTLFCWVSGSLVDRVQEGISANPVDCIHWGKWTDVPHHENQSRNEAT